MMKRKTAALILILAVVIGSLSGAVVTALASDRIAAGVSVADVDVSGLTKRQARERLSPVVQKLRVRPLVLRVEDRRRFVKLRQLGMSPDIDLSADKAYQIGRHGNWIQQAIVRLFSNGADKDLPLCIAFDFDKLDRVLTDISRTVGRKHQDARLRISGGQFIIQPERPGVKVDVDKCVSDIMTMSWKGEPVDLALVEDKPDVTTKDLRTIDTCIASYTTRFPAWKVNRTHNVQLAARMLDGSLVKPGGVFSFNGQVGPRLKKLGYRDAPIFVNGELEPGTGGGVCQVSSTTYNAALLANMKILQRSHHSGSVPYVPLGRDATVAYGLLDLRFRNTASSPIYILAKITGSRLNVSIYGSSADKCSVAISRSGLRRLPHKTIVYTDASLPPGKRVVVRPGHGGYAVSTYRVVYENGSSKRELLSSDYYRPLHTKIAVGPSAPVAGDIHVVAAE